MPIYEFQCRKCGQTFEMLFRSQDKQSGIACPKCKSPRTQRKLSAFSGKIGNTSTGGGCGSCSATSCGPSCRH
jgi:putative FmdB family regulatory protein